MRVLSTNKDSAGEVYVADFGGTVYRVDPE
jgi:hypothetical protein